MYVDFIMYLGEKIFSFEVERFYIALIFNIDFP